MVKMQIVKFKTTKCMCRLWRTGQSRAQTANSVLTWQAALPKPQTLYNNGRITYLWRLDRYLLQGPGVQLHLATHWFQVVPRNNRHFAQDIRAHVDIVTQFGISFCHLFLHIMIQRGSVGYLLKLLVSLCPTKDTGSKIKNKHRGMIRYFSHPYPLRLHATPTLLWTKSLLG